MKAKKTFYISTPIYYPSGNLHIGHVLCTTLAWTYRNFKKLMNYDTFFVTGIDEHGEKIAKKAESLNLKPQDYVDLQAQKFKELWNKLAIDFDHFSRTTNKNHESLIVKVFDQMLAKGLIYKGNYEGLYSVEDEEFFTKTQAKLVEGKYYHPTSNHLLKEVSEESYFFNMAKFNQWIISFFKQNPAFSSNPNVLKELTNNFLKEGLEDLSITRISINWGIKLEHLSTQRQHVIYVWLDALFNYLSALNYQETNDQLYSKYWLNGDEKVHVLGKEIARFHTIYWPIFLHSLGIKLPDKEIIHGWIITPEGKMSKSKGNVIDPLDLLSEFGAEEIKYFFASQVNIDSDYSFSKTNLINYLNADLANNFGNLLNRTAKMINQSFENGTTYEESHLLDIDKEIYTYIDQYFSNYKEHFNQYHADKALNQAINLSSKLNEYIDLTKPWTLKADLNRLNVILNTLLNGIYAVNLMLSVVLPTKCKKILEFLSIKEFDLNLLKDYHKFDHKQIDVKEILFPRIK
ncbi:methionine--tRNA ligase [[Mycoplasma] anseris]|uniref:Methionine--tRNA ligase n=1 Tax=[Mycoplasma] anseris TaxID=92400 RepID=A0A2Z4NDR7_9BACT|nr:methionine--tRNA ligase [[Mycoplasma] anseris]AWX69731.1 methionine--tRNA ligase [[Mycoplasma] anseris]